MWTRRLILGLLVLCSLAVGADDRAQKCRRSLPKIIGGPDTVRIGTSGARDSDRYFSLSDSALPSDDSKPFHFTAGLRNGTVAFSVKAVSDSKTERASWRASDAFDQMMDFFGPDRVQRIDASWQYDSTNLELFAEAVRKGAPLEEAAFHTWTGQQALRYGFEFAEIVDYRRSGGNWGFVEVRFTRWPEERRARSRR